MSQCDDYEDIHFYVINVFYGIVIAVYFLPFKKNHPVDGFRLANVHMRESSVTGLT